MLSKSFSEVSVGKWSVPVMIETSLVIDVAADCFPAKARLRVGELSAKPSGCSWLYEECFS